MAWTLLLAACTGGPAPIPPPRPSPDLVQRGAMLFWDSSLSGDGSRSCATCHPGAGSNGLSYRDGEPVPSGSPGARDVPSLRGVWQTPPYLRDGSLQGLAEVVERMLRVEMRAGQVAGHDRDALRAYLESLPPFDRGRILADGTPREPATLSVRRGRQVFAGAGCERCHPPPVFGRARRSDVGTGLRLSAPTLRGVPSTPPYGHDGRWSTLEQAVRAMLRVTRQDLEEEEFWQLIRYLELF